MPVDYDWICAENIEEYGKGTRHLAFLERLYTDRTHFIFEIIQNAEDARATELEFELHPDRLEIRHDGRPFNEADVRGICGVDAGTKSDDLTQIGKFGIGFKSVYAYTRSPEIHCRDEHFRIENYVRPHGVEPHTALGPEETLFIFPFDRDDPTAAMASTEIRTALDNLAPRTLLFLNSIERIRIRGAKTTRAGLERVAVPRGTGDRHVALRDTSNSGRRSEEWFVWSRHLGKTEREAQRVEVAFRATTDEKSQVRALKESPLVAFFPTERETFLGFLVQGPYRTTPARDNIPYKDSWNQTLVHQTAELLRGVLRELRDRGLLTVEVLGAMPLDADRFPPDSMFRPIYDAVSDALRTERLIPVSGGGYAKCADVKLARGAGLRELLSIHQLAQLYRSVEPVHWVIEDVTENRTPRLWRYLRDEAGIDEVTPESVATRLTTKFLVDQSDAWIAHLYGFLDQNPALWRPPQLRRDMPGPARTKAIVRLEDGTHVTPFNEQNHPQAYLPGPADTEFPTVRRVIADVPEARRFLEALRLTTPDVIAEVIEKVLPRYASEDTNTLNDDLHRRDLERIAQALCEIPADRRDWLRRQLRTVRFLQADNVATGERLLHVPQALYWRSRDLETYFEANPDIWFIDEGYRDWFDALSDLGVRDSVRVEARTPNHLGYVVIVEEWGRHERGLDGFDPKAEIAGLEHALRRPDADRSLYIWNALLAPNCHLLRGIVETSTRQEYLDARQTEAQSKIGVHATATAWLPDRDGSYHRPAELQLDDLPDNYKRDDLLAKALSMITPAIEEVSHQLGVPASMLRALQERPDLVALLEQQLKQNVDDSGGSNDEDSGLEATSALEDSVNFAEALTEAFDRRAARALSADEAARGTVENPQLRRERLQAAIKADKAAEPGAEARFRRIPRRVWEARDSAVRHFLLEQYQGHCQLCNDTFAKRDGTAYFEGVYLVSRTNARWLDRPGNIISLCATCCAKFQHGPVESTGILDQIVSWRSKREGGGLPILSLFLCGDEVALRFTEKHMLDLQEMIRNETTEPG